MGDFWEDVASKTIHSLTEDSWDHTCFQTINIIHLVVWVRPHTGLPLLHSSCKHLENITPSCSAKRVFLPLCWTNLLGRHGDRELVIVFLNSPSEPPRLGEHRCIRHPRHYKDTRFFSQTAKATLGAEATARQVPGPGWDGLAGLPVWHRGVLGGTAGDCAWEELVLHPVPLQHCDVSGGTTGPFPERLPLCLAGREGRERSPLLLLSSGAAAPAPSSPLVTFSASAFPQLTAQGPPPNYWRDKPLALQYVPIRLQNTLLRGLLIVNFPRASLKWLFILPIIISLYLSFLIVFFPIINSVFQDFCTVLNLPTHSLFKQSIFKVLKSFEFIIRNVRENNQEKFTSCSYFWSFQIISS